MFLFDSKGDKLSISQTRATHAMPAEALCLETDHMGFIIEPSQNGLPYHVNMSRTRKITLIVFVFELSALTPVNCHTTVVHIVA